jgi:hypothetical protein
MHRRKTLLNRRESRNVVLRGRRRQSLRVAIHYGDEPHRKTGQLQLAVDPQMIATEGSRADYGYAQWGYIILWHRAGSGHYFMGASTVWRQRVYSSSSSET